MPTISAKVSKKELDAIQEYANACGESMSNLIRKVVVGEAIFIRWCNDVKEYNCEISILDNVLGDEETKIVQGTYNKIRGILGLPEIEI
jgi:hypothetical protein